MGFCAADSRVEEEKGGEWGGGPARTALLTLPANAKCAYIGFYYTVFHSVIFNSVNIPIVWRYAGLIDKHPIAYFCEHVRSTGDVNKQFSCSFLSNKIL